MRLSSIKFRMHRKIRKIIRDQNEPRSFEIFIKKLQNKTTYNDENTLSILYVSRFM